MIYTDVGQTISIDIMTLIPPISLYTSIYNIDPISQIDLYGRDRNSLKKHYGPLNITT